MEIPVSFSTNMDFEKNIESLRKEAGVYSERETTDNERGGTVLIGEKLNLYIERSEFGGGTIWILPKSESI